MSAIMELTASAGGPEDEAQEGIIGAAEGTLVSDIRPRYAFAWALLSATFYCGKGERITS